MMSISTIARSGVDSTSVMASFPVVAVKTCMPRRSRTLLSAKILRASSSTRSTVLPTRSSSELCRRSIMRCFSSGSSETTRCRKSAVSSNSRSGDSTPLTTTLRVLLGRQLATRKDNHRDVGERCVVADRFEQVETGHVGQPEIEHDAIRRLLADRRERFLAGTDGHQVDVVMPQKLGDAALLGGVVFDNQEALAAWLYVVLDPRQGGLEVLGRAWLVDKGEGAAS